jgi:hypothetical protein
VLGGEALVMPSRTPVRYERVADPAALLTLWALGPWALAAQGATMMGMLGLSALALGSYMNRPPLMESSAPVT